MAASAPMGTQRIDLRGRVALVTGGSRGIGYSIAAALGENGARVLITGRDAAQLDAARARLSQTDGSADSVHAVMADVRSPTACAQAVDSAVQLFGGLDVLVNNAGVGHFTDVEATTPHDWQQVLETNLSGVFYCCHAAIPHLRRRGGGWIINISSLAGNHPFAGGAAYCASKAGLNAFSEALMQEVRYDNIRVSYIMPGSVSTGFGGRGESGSAEWKIAPEDVAEIVVELITMPSRSLPSRIELRPSRPPKRA